MSAEMLLRRWLSESLKYDESGSNYDELKFARDAAFKWYAEHPAMKQGWMTCPVCGAGSTCFNCRDAGKNKP